MEPQPKQTFFGQLFSGIFLIFWALAVAALIAAIYSMYGNDGNGHDIGLGDGSLLFWFAVAVIVIIFLTNLFNKEARANRNGTTL